MICLRDGAGRRLSTGTFSSIARACVFAIVGATAAVGCSNPESTAGAPAPIEVVVVEPAPQDVPIYAEFVGTLDGFVNAEIRARVPGYITDVHYTEGRPVKAGELLFSIDPVLAQAALRQSEGQLAEAKAALFKADADVSRLQPLVASNAVSRQELDNAVAAQQLAKAQIATSQGLVHNAQANLSYTKVTSPITGIAGLAKVKVGALVGQGEPTLLTTVSQLDPIRARFTISEALYIRFAGAIQRFYASFEADSQREGKLELILVDGTTHPRRGKVAFIDRQVDVTTGTITVEALFANPDSTLRPGQYAKVRGVIDQKKDVLVLPQRAVRELQGLTQVLVVGEGNKVELRSVTMGPRVGSAWVVEGGLEPREKVIVEGLQKAKPGSVVSVKVVPAPVAYASPSAGAPSAAAPPSSAAASAPAASAPSSAPGTVANAPAGAAR